ncbi:MAG TPA: OB-fold nucleic acid binding domain-containing protein [Candidatus Nanoarchaeia archaeon]|nr:OB-fold nucleic acid binding domain-containing protein [Candidatus Nanoarchaeia archaeon]
MKLSELKPRMSKVDIEVEIKSLEEPRTFNKFGKDGRVCNATISDGESEMKLTLWNDEIDKVKVGSKLKITNGYVNEFQGEMQLTAGRFGKLEVIN